MGHIRDLPKSKLGVNEKKGFKPEYRGAAREEEGARRSQEGRREGGRALHRHRPRPGRRGDRLASRPGAGRGPEEHPPHPLQRDHGAGGEGGLPAPRQDRPEQGGRPAGPPRARSARRLQAIAAALGEDPPRALGRAESSRWRCGSSPSASARSPPSCRWSTGRSTRGSSRKSPPEFTATLREVRGREGEPARRGGHRRGDDRAARRPVAREVGDPGRAAPQPRRALHHLHAPAGGEPASSTSAPRRP